MGIYDRDYYRREGPGFLDSLTRRGQVCKWLIGINAAVFLLEFLTRYQSPVGWGEYGPEAFRWHYPIIDWFALDVRAVMQGQVWRLLTYAFLHEPMSIWHITFNMLFLWWFGADVEDIYGPREFLCFYLVAAFLGGLAFQLGWMFNLNMSPRAGMLCIGASGAVTAVLVVCACHYPTRIIYLFMILPVPIWLFVALEVLSDLFGFLGGGGQTAYTVHLAGAAFGFFYHYCNWRVANWLPSFAFLQRQRGRPNLRVYRNDDPPTPVPVAAPPDANVDEQLEAQLDAVLEKVARSGQNSLTESEKQILMRASEIYRRRRT